MTKPSKPRPTKRRRYRVLYAVTRAEYYEIEAKTAEEATDLAFTDGEFVEGGDTTEVIDLDAEQLTP